MDAGNKAKATAKKEAGNKAQQAGDYDAAIAAYSEAIELDPTDHVFYSNRSASYLSKGEAQRAFEDAEKCTELNASWAKGFARKGAALFSLKRWDDAVAAYEQCLTLDPKNASYRADLDQAKEHAARAARPAASRGGFPGGMSDPFGPDMLERLARNPKFLPWLADEKFVEKLTKLQNDPASRSATLGSDPRLLECMIHLMGVKLPQGAEGGAGSGFPEDEEDEEADEEGDVPMVRTATASATAGAAARGGAGASSTPAPAPAPAPAPEEDDADLDPEIKAERAEKRKKRAEAAKKKEEGAAHYKAKRFDEAIACFTAAGDLDPEDMAYPSNVAACWLEKKDYEKAIEASKKAIEVGSANMAPYAQKAKAWGRLGKCHRKLGNLEAAIEAFDNSLLESKDDEIQTLLKQSKAELKFKKEQEYLNPALGEEAKARGNDAYHAGDYPKALAEYSEAIKRDPTNATYWMNRSLARTKLADFNTAMEDIDKAIKIKPDYAKAYAKKGNLQLLMREYHKALDSFQQCLDLEKDNAEAKDGMRRTVMKINESSSASSDKDEERAARAMADPEIQAILKDPMVNAALSDMQSSPAAARKVLSDPAMSAKLQKLVAAGILKLG